MTTMDPGDPLNYRCPGCGGPLGGFDPEDSCTGVRCLRCDDAVVTTNPDTPTFDPTPYSVWVEWAGRDRLRVIAAVGNALGIGARTARELIDGALPVRVGVQAVEVWRLYRRFRHLGLGIRVEPEFRWRLDPRDVPHD